MTELEMLQRVATRYSEIVREHAYLVGLLSLAVRTEDTKLQAATKKRLAEVEFECNECTSTLRALRHELLIASAVCDGEDEVAAVRGMCEYATA